MFFCEICDIFKNTFFDRTHPVAASEFLKSVGILDFIAKFSYKSIANVFPWSDF